MYTKLAVGVIAAAASVALGDTVDFNATLDFPGSAYLDGIVGDGISNANFVRSVSGDIEVGLKAIERFVGDLNNDDDTYFATTGTSVSPSGLQGSTWNYVLAFDLGSSTVSNYQIDLAVDFDPAAGATNFVTLDYTAALEANSLGGLSTFGDSQNLLFDFWQTVLGAPSFDPNAIGEYELRLTIRDRNTNAIEAEVSNTINVVPLPPAAFAGLGLLGSLVGVRAIRRR